MEADKAEGCKFTMVKSIDGINHTLTVWESKDHMVSLIGRKGLPQGTEGTVCIGWGAGERFHEQLDWGIFDGLSHHYMVYGQEREQIGFIGWLVGRLHRMGGAGTVASTFRDVFRATIRVKRLLQMFP